MPKNSPHLNLLANGVLATELSVLPTVRTQFSSAMNAACGRLGENLASIDWATGQGEEFMTKKWTEADDGAADPAEGLAPDAQDAIARRFRSVYGRLVAEPLPDKVVQLLDELAKLDSSGKKT